MLLVGISRSLLPISVRDVAVPVLVPVLMQCGAVHKISSSSSFSSFSFLDICFAPHFISHVGLHRADHIRTEQRRASQPGSCMLAGVDLVWRMS